MFNQSFQTNVLPFAQAEGFTGVKKEFYRDPWPDIYAARQNRTILQGIPTQLEVHELNGKEELCLVVFMDGVKCLLPFQEAGVRSTDPKNNRNRLRKLIGHMIAFIIIGIDRDNNLAIISRKAAKEAMAKTFWKTAKVGKIVTAVALEVTPNSVLVDLGGVETRIPVQELSHGWIQDVRDMIKPGEAFDVKIIDLDKENQKVKVSLKALLPDPYPECLNRYRVGNEYLGTVTGVVEYGIFVNLEPGVDALIPHFRNKKVNVGDKVIIRIKKIKPEERKIVGIGIRVI